MFRLFSLVSLTALILVLPASASADAAERLFKKYECADCHSVKSLGIERNKKKKKKKKDGEKEKFSDLSNVGGNHDAAYLTDYLLKKIKHTPHDDFDTKKKHKKKFKGSDKDLEKLVAWILTLKE